MNQEENDMNGNVVDASATLVAALHERGVFRSQAVKLLSSLAQEHLYRVGNYIEYWDLQRKLKTVTPGLLYDLIRNGDPLPVGFESKQQRELRLQAEEHRKTDARLNQELERRYQEYSRECIDRLIAELPPDEFEKRVIAKREETALGGGFWGERPDLADQLARHEVRAEIEKAAALPSLEEFRQQELARIMSDQKLAIANPGVELPQPPTHLETDMPSNLVNPPIANEVPPMADFPSSEANVAPGGI